MNEPKKVAKTIMPYGSGSLNTLSRNGSPPLDQRIGRLSYNIRLVTQCKLSKYLKTNNLHNQHPITSVLCNVALIILLLTFHPFSTFAAIDPNLAIRAIVGEAEGESYTGKVAVAEAIRNRGNLKGVYGVKSPRLQKASKKVWMDAEKAWKESAKSNLVEGASFWESSDFKTPYWAKDMVVTAKHGKHVFYKEVRK